MLAWTAFQKQITNENQPSLGSLDKELRKNADGTVDIYFGPKPSTGQESNWLYTQPGQKWFPWFRVYGPEKAIFDKSWRLPDIEKITRLSFAGKLREW